MSDVIEQSQVRRVLQELYSRIQKQQFEESDHKLGRILTIIDWVTSDPEQRKAIKDLVRNTWYLNTGLQGLTTNKSEIELAAEAIGFELWDKLPKGKNQIVKQAA